MTPDTAPDTRPDYEIARDAFAACMAAHGITVAAAFVPWSRSRHATPADRPLTGRVVTQDELSRRSLNWWVTVCTGDRAILSTDYSAGIGHCPCYKAHRAGTLRWTIDAVKALEHEIETGIEYRDTFSAKRPAPILPDPVDVLAALVQDADVLNYNTYEEWAADLGMDPDSRKGEAMYRACLETALALRNGIGSATLETLASFAHRL